MAKKTSIVCPDMLPGNQTRRIYRNVFTGENLNVGEGNKGALLLADVFKTLPVAALEMGQEPE